MRALLFLVGVSLLSPAAAAGPPPLDWVALEGGCFTMGETRIYPEEAPRRQACVSAFEVTRTEVTTAQFAAFVEATGYVTQAEKSWHADQPDGSRVEMPPGSAVFILQAGTAPKDLNWWQWVEGANWRSPHGDGSAMPAGDYPIVHVTQADAMAFASWAGGRLPTEAEWEYAARGGTDGALLAWDEAEAVAAEDKANTWQGIFPVIDTGEDGFAGIAPVASFPANGFGLHDMIGNVWEWTATPYAPSHAERDRTLAGPDGLDFSQPGVPVGTIKGGSYLCAPSYCFRFRPAARQAQDLAYGTSHIGFRLVRDATTARLVHRQ